MLIDVAAAGDLPGSAGCCVIAGPAVVPQALRHPKLRRLPAADGQGVLRRGARLPREYLRRQDVADYAEQQERRHWASQLQPECQYLGGHDQEGDPHLAGLQGVRVRRVSMLPAHDCYDAIPNIIRGSPSDHGIINTHSITPKRVYGL